MKNESKWAIFCKLMRCKFTRRPYLQELTEREDLSKRSTEELMNILKNYRCLHYFEIAVILAELKVRESKI